MATSTALSASSVASAWWSNGIRKSSQHSAKAVRWRKPLTSMCLPRAAGLTKTWFHTGVYIEGQEISRHLAAEYYGAPDESDTANFELF